MHQTKASIRYTCLLALLLCPGMTSAAQGYDTAVVVRVKDGDTFVAQVRQKKATIRLIGIDAPESHYNAKVRRDAIKTGTDPQRLVAKGLASSAFLGELLKPGTRVRLEYDVRKRDRYGRLLCYAYLPDGRMLNEVIVRNGHAVAKRYPPNVRHQKVLEKAAGGG